MKRDVDIRVVDSRLKDLAIYFTECSPERFGLAHHSADCPVKGITVDLTTYLNEQAKLPLRPGPTRLLRKPDVKLLAGRQQRPVIMRHWTPKTAGLNSDPPL
ncbi:hypothetical protein AU189_19855 [Mycolicibacterium acapulense]|nr:hypothetical protein AU189_19855 [Mycolicibacterium acapulense]